VPHKSSRELDLCGMLRPLTFDDAVCVNTAVEINVLDYNVAVRQLRSQSAAYGPIMGDIVVQHVDFYGNVDTLCDVVPYVDGRNTPHVALRCVA